MKIFADVILAGAARPGDLDLAALEPHRQIPRLMLGMTCVALLVVDAFGAAHAQTWTPQQSGTAAELRG